MNVTLTWAALTWLSVDSDSDSASSLPTQRVSEKPLGSSASPSACGDPSGPRAAACCCGSHCSLVSLEWEAFPVPSCWGHGSSHQGHSQGQELLTPALQNLSSPPRSWSQQSFHHFLPLSAFSSLSASCVPLPFSWHQLLTGANLWVCLAQKPLRQQFSRQSPLESMLNTDPWAHSQGSDSSGLGWNLRICISSKVPGDAQESGPHCNTIIPNGENKIPSFPSLQKCRHREGVRYGKLQDCWNTNISIHFHAIHHLLLNDKIILTKTWFRCRFLATLLFGEKGQGEFHYISYPRWPQACPRPQLLLGLELGTPVVGLPAPIPHQTVFWKLLPPAHKLRQWFFFLLPGLVIEKPGIICRMHLQVKCLSDLREARERGSWLWWTVSEKQPPGAFHPLASSSAGTRNPAYRTTARRPSCSRPHSICGGGCPWKGLVSPVKAEAAPWASSRSDGGEARAALPRQSHTLAECCSAQAAFLSVPVSSFV